MPALVAGIHAMAYANLAKRAQRPGVDGRDKPGHDDILASVRNCVHIGVMRTTSYSDLRKNLAATLDRVTEDHEPVVITRDKGKPAAVLISLEDFASYEETSYLLQSPRNAERLRAAIQELDAGRGKERKLVE
ncbi:type II toxin-antitoxin system Phd/YefM family antitoxin [Methylocystis rosea]|nr:type II toxin-antitoxin system prevent-host-death family antitoxin [Methylocystis rosea]